MKKFKVVPLGCRTNQYESQGYADQLRQMGYVLAQEGEAADLCIVNTCTVTEGADSSSRHQIRSLLREHPGAKVAVTGCMAESAPEVLLGMDSRIQIVPNAEKERLIDQIFPEEENLPEFNIQALQHPASPSHLSDLEQKNDDSPLTSEGNMVDNPFSELSLEETSTDIPRFRSTPPDHRSAMDSSQLLTLSEIARNTIPRGTRSAN